MARRKPSEPTPEEKAKRAQDLEDIRHVMQNAGGRRFMWRLLQEANIFRSCFTGNSNTFYLEGRREFMLPFYQDIMTICPELFWVAQQENFKKEESANAARSDDEPDAGSHE